MSVLLECRKEKYSVHYSKYKNNNFGNVKHRFILLKTAYV
jgi:hypothetical protein